MRIVIAEDSKTQARQLALLLQSEGFEVEVAHDGQEAYECCVRVLPDLVISDVLMPRVNGFDLCRRIRGNPDIKAVPILLLTALGRSQDVLDALSAGADSFLTKPYRSDRLLERVRIMTGSIPPAEQGALHLQGLKLAEDAPKSQLIGLFLSALEDVIDKGAELERNRAALEVVVKRREQMMAVVAHELRHPLQSLLLRAELSHHDDKALRALPGAVETQAGTMIRFIDDLVDFSTVDAGTFQIERRNLDLRALVHDVTNKLIPEQQACIHSTMPSTPVMVSADPTRIEQVVHNLLSNAFKYGQAQEPIELRVQSTTERATIHIKDRGPGIEDEHLGNLFNPFFRTSEGRRAARGVGLGLYICKRIIELHGGEIGVHSQAGQGSEFWLALPLLHL